MSKLSKNPFRNPALLTPQPTGISVSSSSSPSGGPTVLPAIQISSSPPLPSLPTPEAPPSPAQTFQPPPGPPPNAQSPPSQGGGGGTLEAEDLDAEAPPAYTPSADSYLGESTLEVGPRRPFQRVAQQPQQPQPPQPQFAPPPQQPPSVNPQGTGIGNEWDQYQRHTGQSQRPSQRPGPTTTSNANLRPAPPRHPQSPSSNLRPSRTPPASTSPTPTQRAGESVSDFARDFYAAGAASEDGTTSSSSHSHYTPPSGPPPPTSTSPTSSHYAPPPGAPPRPKSSSGVPSGTSGTGTRRTSAIPDDGRPTKDPKPGHPLLLNGKLLVYPNGHECHKCNNTGFKNFDPSHPCRKCWDRYARPYAGALAYTPWSNDNNNASSSTSGTNFQRPLPTFRPPQQQQQQPSSRSSPSQRLTNQRHHPRSISSPNLSPAQPFLTPTPAPAPRVQLASPYSGPPPGSTVVQPGDPRIGGQLCYKCMGSGVVPFFLFEEVTCEKCGGIGRVF